MAAATEESGKTVNIPLSFTEKGCIDTGMYEGHTRGQEVQSREWVSTDFIDISRFVALRYELAGTPYCFSVSFFDKDKNFLSGITTESILTFSMLVGHTPVPEGAKYAKFINFLGTYEYSAAEKPFVEGFLTQEEYTHYKTAILKHDGLKIVCLGDSLTEGHQGWYKQSLSYPYFLAKFLGCETVNHGRSGYTAMEYFDLFSEGEINVSDADLVLIMLGSNGGLTYSGKLQLNGYKNLILQVKKQVKPGCRVILLTPTNATRNPDRMTYGWFRSIENAAMEVRKVAEEEGFELIDVFTESPIQPENEDMYQPVDGVHMCAAGYEALAKFLAAKIEELLKK